MDKSQQKAIKNQYKAEAKQKHLLRLGESDNAYIRALAQIELGHDLPPITKAIINTEENGPDGLDLATRIYLKILEKAYKSSPYNKSIYKVLESTVMGLSEYLQAVYYSSQFESAISVGDIDKEFSIEGDFEEKLFNEKLDKLIAAYRLMENEKMLSLIERARSANDYDLLQQIAAGYNQEKMDKVRIEFIKKNAEEFEMQ